jgi:hypothetical protein
MPDYLIKIKINKLILLNSDSLQIYKKDYKVIKDIKPKQINKNSIKTH